MFKNNLKLSLLFLIMGVLIFSFPLNAQAFTEKISGIDRYATSAQIALNGWNRSMFAVLVSGDNFPDAISAAPLAKQYSAPILLTKKDYIPTEILNAIKELKITNIILIGGTEVISTSIEDRLISLGIKTDRISGRDRYETSINIAKYFKINNNYDINEVALVSGEEFTDGISIAPIASNKHMPIVLIQHNKIPDEVKDFLENCSLTKTYVIGVGSSIDRALVSQFPNAEQINGDDKYQRNLAVIDKFKNEMDLNAIYLASGENFADGLSGIALASISFNPVLLVGENATAQKNYLNNNLKNNYNIVVLGGRINNLGLISPANIDFEEKKISDLVNINLNDISKIVFYDGRGGLNKPLTLEDKQKVREFIGYLDGYLVKKIPDPYTVGWIHDAVFYNNDNTKVMEITFGNPLLLNNGYYKVIKGDLSTEEIDSFLKSVDASWKTSR